MSREGTVDRLGDHRRISYTKKLLWWNPFYFFKTVRKEKRDRKVAPTTARVRKRNEKRDRKDSFEKKKLVAKRSLGYSKTFFISDIFFAN